MYYLLIVHRLGFDFLIQGNRKLVHRKRGSFQLPRLLQRNQISLAQVLVYVLVFKICFANLKTKVSY